MVGLDFPRRAGFDDGVGDCDQPSCDCDDDKFVWFSALFETLCDRLESWIVIGGGERSLEQHMSSRPSTARNRSSTSHRPAVM